MALIDIIRDDPQWNDDDIVAMLKTIVSVPKPSELYTISGVGEVFGAVGVDISIQLDIEGFIRSLIGGPSMASYLTSAGKLDFTIPGILQNLYYNAQVEAGNPTRLAAVLAMISIGAPVDTPNWKLFGLDHLPTVDEVKQQRIVLATTNWVATVKSLLDSALERGDSVDKIKSLIAGA